MSEIIDDKIALIDRTIASLMEERQERIDFLNDPVIARVKKIYGEIAELFTELAGLGDEAYDMEDVYQGYDEVEETRVYVTFEGKYFKYVNGKIESK